MSNYVRANYNNLLQPVVVRAAYNFSLVATRRNRERGERLQERVFGSSTSQAPVEAREG